jgi:hypothetical protein
VHQTSSRGPIGPKDKRSSFADLRQSLSIDTDQNRVCATAPHCTTKRGSRAEPAGTPQPSRQVSDLLSCPSLRAATLGVQPAPRSCSVLGHAENLTHAAAVTHRDAAEPAQLGAQQPGCIAYAIAHACAWPAAPHAEGLAGG